MRISDWSSDVCSSDLVDDNVLRVGSSNFNNRSLRLDTECDVVIDATRNANADERRIIASIRDSLLAEHLGSDCHTVAAMLNDTGSLIQTVEYLRSEGRSLRVYEVHETEAVREWMSTEERRVGRESVSR